MLQLNAGRVLHILKDFYVLTKIRIVVFDDEFREILSYPTEHLGFCAKLRQDAAENAKCRESDQNNCLQCAKAGKLVIYRCHMGLTEAVVPILDKDKTIGYIMFGQIISEENCRTVREQLEMRCPHLMDEIEQIAVKPEEELSAAATVLQALTAYVMNNRWAVPQKAEFIQQLDSYIEANLSQSITVRDLCMDFHLDKNKMYRLSFTYLGCGLAEYVRTKRILYAQQMLAQTDLPVSEVACAVGFPDYNYFSLIFRQVTGTSAREYRKTNGLCT